MDTKVKILVPSIDHLESYKAALRKGWSPNNLRPEAANEELEAISKDSHCFLAGLTDLEAKGGPIKMPDGSHTERLPGFIRWIWDGEFCGVIGFRWKRGTEDLPPHVPGHIGYTVVPWKRGRGYATTALSQLLAQLSLADSDNKCNWIEDGQPVNSAPSSAKRTSTYELLPADRAGTIPDLRTQESPAQPERDSPIGGAQ